MPPRPVPPNLCPGGEGTKGWNQEPGSGTEHGQDIAASLSQQQVALLPIIFPQLCQLCALASQEHTGAHGQLARLVRGPAGRPAELSLLRGMAGGGTDAWQRQTAKQGGFQSMGLPVVRCLAVFRAAPGAEGKDTGFQFGASCISGSSMSPALCYTPSTGPIRIAQELCQCPSIPACSPVISTLSSLQTQLC